MLQRPVLVATAMVLLLLGLGGCASSSGAPNKVQAAVESLGGNPDQLYQELVVFKTVDVMSYDSQLIYLVPSKDGKDFQIVDAHGEIYRDYNDFIRNNRLTG